METPLSPSILNREQAAALLSLDERTQEDNSEVVPEKKEYECYKCDYIFTNKKVYERHLRLIHNFECDQCHYAFITNVHLQIHKSKHGELLSERIHKFKCDQCQSAFKANIYLKTHKYEEHGELMKKAMFTCDPCNVSYKTRQAFARHNRITHEGDLTP